MLLFRIYNTEISNKDEKRKVAILDDNAEGIKQNVIDKFDDKKANAKERQEIIIKTENDKVKYVELGNNSISVDSTDNYFNATYIHKN